jgi:lipoprotein-anchoring transpeptidase ErfK/SrfK
MRNSIAVICAILIGLLLSSFSPGAAVAEIDIRIDKSSQLMTVAVNGRHRYTWKVSTGKSGYTTPSGTFRPFRMERHHRSDEWDNAPMPYSIFFTYEGHAIHGSPHTRRLGTAVSHGCVRLAPRNAATLYSLVKRQGLGKTKVTIANGGIAASATPDVQPSSNRTMLDWVKGRR